MFDFGANEYHALFNPAIHAEVILGWSTNGCQLAYSSEDGSLWLANIHNLIRKQVLSGYEAPQSEVIWSPTGEWVAYAAQSPEDIFIIRPDGSGRVQLTRDNYVDKIAGWSSNGQEVLFWSKHDAGWELYATALPTLTTRLLTKLPSIDFLPELTSPDNLYAEVRPGPLSPDHRYSAIMPYIENQQGWSYKLYVLDLQTGQSRSLSDRWIGIKGVTWSPDGKTLAAGIYDSQDDSRSGIHLLDVTSRRHTILATNSKENDLFSYPSWSPDGRKLVFLGTTSPWVYDFDAKSLRRLLPEAELADSVQWYSPLVWSPKLHYKSQDCQLP